MAQPDLLELYRVMLLARMLDERIWQLNRQGRAHFAVPVAGHEGVAGYAFALNPTQDYLVPHYRDLSALLHFGLTTVLEKSHDRRDLPPPVSVLSAGWRIR